MSEKIKSRGELATEIAVQTELPVSSVEAVLKTYEALIAQHLEAGGEIRLPGFGTFKTTDRAERTARNPRTGEPLTIAARSVVRFTPGKSLKEVGAAPRSK
ncbi:HU family DNA-binding protein [bacterium]|nr:MAG: HU family DNA-binding protein [bacterium]